MDLISTRGHNYFSCRSLLISRSLRHPLQPRRLLFPPHQHQSYIAPVPDPLSSSSYKPQILLNQHLRNTCSINLIYPSLSSYRPLATLTPQLDSMAAFEAQIEKAIEERDIPGCVLHAISRDGTPLHVVQV